MNNMCKPPKVLTLSEIIRKLKVSKKPIMVKFFTAWCGACQEAKSEIHEAKCALEGEIETVAIDTDEQEMIAAEFGIQSLPTVAIIQQGKVMTQTEGAEQAADYINIARKWLAENDPNNQ